MQMDAIRKQAAAVAQAKAARKAAKKEAKRAKKEKKARKEKHRAADSSPDSDAQPQHAPHRRHDSIEPRQADGQAAQLANQQPPPHSNGRHPSSNGHDRHHTEDRQTGGSASAQERREAEQYGLRHSKTAPQAIRNADRCASPQIHLVPRLLPMHGGCIMKLAMSCI